MRHAKKLQSKSRQHMVVVDDISKSRYKVTSAGSGKEYLVNVFADSSAGCSCNWSQYNNQHGKSACSHVIAVLNFVHNGEWKNISAWASEDEAKLQHRPMLNIGDGVVLTVRKVHKVYRQTEFLNLAQGQEVRYSI